MTFDAVVTADDAGAYKPALNHFQLALAQLAEMGVPKDRGCTWPIASTTTTSRPSGSACRRRAGRGPDAGATPPAPASVTPDAEVPTLAALVDLHRNEQAG